jgi:hypothetical protein
VQVHISIHPNILVVPRFEIRPITYQRSSLTSDQQHEKQSMGGSPLQHYPQNVLVRAENNMVRVWQVGEEPIQWQECQLFFMLVSTILDFYIQLLKQCLQPCFQKGSNQVYFKIN